MSNPLDRRKFFGSAAALSLSAGSYANVPGSNDRVRVAFVGCGGRAQAHIDLVTRFAIPRGWPPDVARRYMTQHLKYDIGPCELDAIRLFHQLAAKHGILASAPRPLEVL